jgi:ABC-type transport system substrate-binding protein
MVEAGFSRDRDGFFIDTNGQRFQPILWNSSNAIHQTAALIVLDNWRRAGIDVQSFVMPAAMERDQEARSTWPSIIIHTMGGNPEQSAFNNMISEKVSSPANRWAGSNRGGWSHPEFDRVWERYNNALSRDEQVQHFVQLTKLHSELLPNYPLYFALNVITHVSGLKGPDGHSAHWNIHEWEFTR